MLGINDPQIWIAYVLCFLSAFGCIIYGALKWNVGAEEEIEKEIAECTKRIESAEKEAAE